MTPSRRGHRRGECPASVLEAYLGWLGTADGRRWLVHYHARYDMRPPGDVAARLPAVRCPVAIIWGDRDPYCPFAIAEDLARRIPGGALTRLAGADHYVMEERPDEVTRALQDLLARPRAV